MTDYLADTNVIFRWAMPNETGHALCRLAIRRLYQQNARIFVTGQILMETWAVMTRPQIANGLGLPTTEALAVIRRIRRGFPLLEESAEVYTVWQRLAARYGIVGRQVYDTRLVAMMQIHGVSHILALNGTHFRRFDGITVIAPEDVS